MEKRRNVQMTVRVSPEVLKAVRESAEGVHGMRYLVDKAIKAYLKTITK